MLSELTIRLDAAQYERCDLWRQNSLAMYEAAYELDLVKDICRERGWQYYKRPTFNILLKAAEKYETEEEWREHDAANVAVAVSQKFIGTIRDHRGWEHRKIARRVTEDDLLASAQQFSSLSEWAQRNRTMYGHAVKKGKQRLIGEILGWKMHPNHRKTSA